GGPVSENGEVLFVEGIIQDIDTKKKEDLALQEAFRELDKIQQGINNHFIVSKVSPDGIFLSVNQNFEFLTGYHREEIVGKHVSMLRSDFVPSGRYEEIFKEV